MKAPVQAAAPRPTQGFRRAYRSVRSTVRPAYRRPCRATFVAVTPAFLAERRSIFRPSRTTRGIRPAACSEFCFMASSLSYHLIMTARKTWGFLGVSAQARNRPKTAPRPFLT